MEASLVEDLLLRPPPLCQIGLYRTPQPPPPPVAASPPPPPRAFYPLLQRGSRGVKRGIDRPVSFRFQGLIVQYFAPPPPFPLPFGEPPRGTLTSDTGQRGCGPYVEFLDLGGGGDTARPLLRRPRPGRRCVSLCLCWRCPPTSRAQLYPATASHGWPTHMPSATHLGGSRFARGSAPVAGTPPPQAG